MRIKEFLDKTYTDFKPFPTSQIWKIYQWHMLEILSPRIDKRFETKKELLAYELRSGDKVSLAKCVKSVGNAKSYTIDDLKTVKGVGPKLRSNIEEIMGKAFFLRDLESNAGSITGLGASTLESIKESLG